MLMSNSICVVLAHHQILGNILLILMLILQQLLVHKCWTDLMQNFKFSTLHVQNMHVGTLFLWALNTKK